MEGARAALEAGSRRLIENLAIAEQDEEGLRESFFRNFLLVAVELTLELSARGNQPPSAKTKPFVFGVAAWVTLSLAISAGTSSTTRAAGCCSAG